MDKHQRPHTIAIVGTRGFPSYYGGFETAVRRLAPYLASREWQVRVYGRVKSRDTPQTQAHRGIEVVSTPGIDSRSLSTLTYGLTSVLHALRRKPDVALVMNVANGYWLPLLKLRGVRTLVNVDGIEWERDKWSRLGKLVFRVGAQLTAMFADELVFDAEAIRDYWRNHFDRDGVCIPYGGDPESGEPLPKEFPDYLLVVARFVPENSIKFILDSAPAIIAETGLHVVLVGTAPPGDPLQQQADALARDYPHSVHLLGHISDDTRLFSLWRNCEVYFHGHTVGGTNPALVQAMALGANVVAVDTVYNREVLGDSGVLCTVDASSLLEAIQVARASKDALSAAARCRAAQHYSWQSICEAYDMAARRLLGGRARF